MNTIRCQIMVAIGLMLASFSGLASSPSLSQSELDDFAQGAELRFGVESNFLPQGEAFETRLSIINQSQTALPEGESDWRIYVHFVRRILSRDLPGITISHLQGDLYELAPTDEFPGIEKGETFALTFTARGHMVSYSEMMPRAFIAQEGAAARVFENTDTEDQTLFVDAFSSEEQTLRFPSDQFAVQTAQTRFSSNQKLAASNMDAGSASRVVPKPMNMSYRRGITTLDGNWAIRHAGGLANEGGYLQSQLKRYHGLALDAEPDHIESSGRTIHIQIDSALEQPESYQFSIEARSIRIVGADAAGAYYGIQTLLGLLPAEQAESYDLRRMEVADAPRFSWRGMHYDMARNFHGKEVTLRLIEQMGRYKLNKLHLHLTDDEGWRIEIPGLPELTDVGGFRCFSRTEDECLLTQLGSGPHRSGSGNGYYSRSDFIEILQFAALHHVEVVPEIDMPGHSRAAIKAMEARYRSLKDSGDTAAAEQFLLTDPNDTSEYLTVQSYSDNSIDVCLPSTYAFVEKVVYELQAMYRDAGSTLSTFHMGGDEVGKGSWAGSPACQALIDTPDNGVAGTADLKPYFVSRVADITRARGLAMVAWEDGLMYDPRNPFNRREFANERIMANAWDTIWESGLADRAHRLANAGYEVILSPATHLYFDHPHEANPHERGYYWAARYTDVAKVFGFLPDDLYANANKAFNGTRIDNLEAMVGRPLPELNARENIQGIQGQVWTETIRTPEQLEQMVYPRLLALAERAWFKADWESGSSTEARHADWVEFASTLATKELPKLAGMGVDFYLPPPGGVIEDGTLKANTSMPGLVIEYSLDEGSSWREYEGTIRLNSPEQGAEVLLRSRVGDQMSRSTRVQ
ncbi:family 20 glycosylhydrolase [Marinimicrobium alkaliphilum]|uniref:family 20 glycosylhydrolase n=1 Tax=Marinimicrobium alkaliphilum TaxID=2202654 RepID=UPI001E2F959C|nr:family 20 glycosylhydrolase [Marinimicrobium alkaliphilum]